MTGDLRDRQRADYIDLLLHLAQGNPNAKAGLCDRIERAIAARAQMSPRRPRSHAWPVLARRSLTR